MCERSLQSGEAPPKRGQKLREGTTPLSLSSAIAALSPPGAAATCHMCLDLLDVLPHVVRDKLNPHPIGMVLVVVLRVTRGGSADGSAPKLLARSDGLPAAPHGQLWPRLWPSWLSSSLLPP